MKTNRPSRWTSQAGFSLAEMLIAIGIMMAVTGTMFTLINPAQGTFRTQPEVSEMQQRLRIGVDVLQKDLLMAGSGSYMGTQSGSLGFFFATVLPFRQGLLGDDPPGTFRTDTVTLIYVPPTIAQTTITQDMPATSAELKVDNNPPCADLSCGFYNGMNVMIYDNTGSYDTFTITNVQGNAGHLQHNLQDLSKQYSSGAKIVQMNSSTYYLKTDNANKVYQLMHYSGDNTADQPVVDNVVGLQFDYYGDPNPPVLISATKTTYGPTPPAPGTQPTAYPVNENCMWTMNAGNSVPRLPTLNGGGQSLVHLNDAGIAGSSLTDGPWCPDATNPNRWDADLLRIRKIAVRLRVQAALSALRGPAGALFTYGGTSTGAYSYAPDQEIRFEVTPRNLNLGR